MDAGDLNRRVKLQKPGGADDYGHGTAWVDVLPHPVWANVRPIGARELMRAGAPAGQITHTVAIRYRKDLEPIIQLTGMRLLYGDRVLNVTSAMDLEDSREWIVMSGVEGTHDGR